MEEIKKYSFILCLISIFCTLFEMLIPPGKISKTMHTVISLFAVTLAVLPIYNTFKKIDFEFKNFENVPKIKETSNLANSIDDQTLTLASENIKELIATKLKEIGVQAKKIEIFMDKNKDNSILMIKCKIYIESEFEKYKSKIENEISEKLSIKTEVIEV